MNATDSTPSLVYTTPFGSAYLGDSRDLFSQSIIPDNSVDLLMMSPPFALLRKKDYGNKSSQEYIEWFLTFVSGFKRVLKDTGSIVIDIGGAYIPGRPQRSTYHFSLAVALANHFELCQEFYWYNPAKLPSPIGYVNIQRIRVKDSVNLVLWFAKDAARAKANNRKVLRKYSARMESLLKDGHQYSIRPSGHDISANFSRNNGGSIAPNILAIPNTASATRYQRECTKHRLKPHPARFPLEIPEFFIQFLTDEGDMVCDPFGGSNTTGEAAEASKRRWMYCDTDGTYVRTSAFRFPEAELEPAFVELPKPNYFPASKHTQSLEKMLSQAIADAGLDVVKPVDSDKE